MIPKKVKVSVEGDPTLEYESDNGEEDDDILYGSLAYKMSYKQKSTPIRQENSRYVPVKATST